MSPLSTHRFMLSPCGNLADWIHPAEIAARCPDWTDCTGMSDELFETIISERQLASRLAGVAA